MKHFITQEFVPPEIYNLEKLSSINRIDPRMIETMDLIWEHFNSIHPCHVYINNWSFGGKYQYRGFRPETCLVGALHSMHRLGKAIDFDVILYTEEEVRKEIINNRELFKYITRMEEGVNWVHIDCKETGVKEYYIFNS